MSDETIKTLLLGLEPRCKARTLKTRQAFSIIRFENSAFHPFYALQSQFFLVPYTRTGDADVLDTETKVVPTPKPSQHTSN